MENANISTFSVIYQDKNLKISAESSRNFSIDVGDAPNVIIYPGMVVYWARQGHKVLEQQFPCGSLTLQADVVQGQE